MRKIEKQMVAAVAAKQNWMSGNTAVLWDGDALQIRLYGNEIARGRVVENRVCILAVNLCGWNTATTRSRLSALGVPVSTKRGVPQLKGSPIPETGWVWT